MKKLFAAVILFSSAFVSAAEMPLLNLQIQPDFDKKFECVWKSKSPLKVWVGPIEDARDQKEVGTLIIKDQATPLFAEKPVTSVLQEALKRGWNRCGYPLVGQKETADIWVTGRLEDFSGSSKKGFMKGEARGRAEFTLNLHQPASNEQFSVSFELEETQSKGISKKPKKLEQILNNLLTRTALNVFESRRVGEWLSAR